MTSIQEAKLAIDVGNAVIDAVEEGEVERKKEEKRRLKLLSKGFKR